MSVITETEPITGELIPANKEIPILYNISDAKIEEMRSEFTGLKIANKADYEHVTKAIAVLRTTRVSVEKQRKALKEHALEFGRKVDAEAKRLTAELESIELPLKAEKQRVDDEAEAAKLEAMKPDLQKIRDFARVIRELQAPHVTADESVAFLGTVYDKLLAVANECDTYCDDWQLKHDYQYPF